MDNRENSITLLTCYGKGKRAAKKIIKNDNGLVNKIGFNAGMFYEHEEKAVSNIYDIAKIIDGISSESRKAIIRGKIRNGMSDVVQRKLHNPDAAFDPIARPYVMLDIDKLKCPDHYDASKNPKQVAKWAIATLPKVFQNVTCYYKFSSSQNVPDKEGNTQKGVVSIHLWFWCDRPVLDEEWKRYLKAVSAPVDTSLFNAVQLHFTANPIFENMDDPLPKRSGIIGGVKDYVLIPNIPEPQSRAIIARIEEQPIISKEDREKGLNLLIPSYQDGGRNRLCGALAATLYRKGWKAENAAHFVLELAETCSDEEAYSRYENAIRICDAVDQGRRAQGIPVLKDELKIDRLDEILNLLGASEPDINQLIEQLTDQSKIPDIERVLKSLLQFSGAEKNFYLDKISKRTKANKPTLHKLLKSIDSKKIKLGPQDYADILTENFLSNEYENGKNLLNSADKLYWFYNSLYWEKIPLQHIKKRLQPYARNFILRIEEGSLVSFNNAVLNILEGRVYRENDPLRAFSVKPKPVMNCQNGELWFDKKGGVTLKPHRADSYLRACLDVHYDPNAMSPMFDEAVLEIFSNSVDPQDMFRHFMELMGYICQYEREHAIIVLLHGGGSNGKTSLVKIIRHILGKNTVMSDRISDIENNVFKIGDLDGKLMLLDDDVDGGTCLPDGFLKKISEEKAMTGQHKHKDPFEFICRAVPVMLANDYPVTRDLTKGLRRRLMVIPFKRTFEMCDMKPGLFEEIWEKESAGILNHAVNGFQRLKERGNFQQPEDVLDAQKQWIARANILTTFIEEECELGDNYSVHLGDFYEVYRDYCHEVGVRNKQSRRGVESRLEALGYRIGQLHGKKAVWGLKLVSQFDVNPENKSDVKL